MARKLDILLVIDVESTCWDGPPPPGEDNEIIEIGVCPLDVRTGERLGRESLLVRPARSSVSPFCTQLTSLTPEQVAQGVPFEDACRILQRKYLSRERAWASYGDYDRRQFERQCETFRVPYPFGPGHVNVKTLFALAHGLERELGMAEALRHLHLPLEGILHRGGDDAWNIAAILSRLLLRVRGERP